MRKLSPSALLLWHVVRISAWTGEARGGGKPGRVVSMLLVRKVEGDGGVWCLPRLGPNQMYLARMVNHFSKTLVDPGWWTGDWRSKRSSVVLDWMLCSYSSKLPTQVPLGRQPKCCQNYARWRPQSSTDYIPRNFFFSSLTSMLRKYCSLSCTERWEWEWTWLGVHIVKKNKNNSLGFFLYLRRNLTAF